MLASILQKSPVIVLKESISREFQDILDEPRVQHLLVLLDRINHLYSIVRDFNPNIDTTYHKELLDKDVSKFNNSLENLRREVQ